MVSGCSEAKPLGLTENNLLSLHSSINGRPTVATTAS